MAIYMTTSTEPSNISGYTVGAEAIVGGNGSLYGPTGYDIGGPTDPTGARVQWDSNLSNGFSTGLVPVELHLRAGGGYGSASWFVMGSKPGDIVCDTDTFSTIDQVLIRVGAAGQDTTAELSQLSVGFYSNGVLVDQENAGSIQASSTSPAGYAETDATITPDVGGSNDPNGSGISVDEVIITGYVQLSDTDPNFLPAPDQIFVQAFVFAS
jgi:hypothetical protein